MTIFANLAQNNWTRNISVVSGWNGAWNIMFFGLIGLKFGGLGCTPSRTKNPKGIFLVVSYKRLLRFRKWTKSVSKDYVNIRQYIPVPSFL